VASREAGKATGPRRRVPGRGKPSRDLGDLLLLERMTSVQNIESMRVRGGSSILWIVSSVCRSSRSLRGAVKNHLESPQRIKVLSKKLFNLKMASVSLYYAKLLNIIKIRKIR